MSLRPGAVNLVPVCATGMVADTARPLLGSPTFTVLKPELVAELLKEGQRLKEEEEAAEKAKKEAQQRSRKAVKKDDAGGK